MSKRVEIVGDFYNQYDEDTRLARTRHGQVEYRMTMNYIHRFTNPGSKILEVGAGTGRYSIALAKEGLDVTAVELVESNLEILQRNAADLDNITALQGDATNLNAFADDSFDVTLLLGPMYHLYEKVDVDKAIDEAVRVTRPGGTIIFAFISVFAIMYSNYFYGRWGFGEKLNFTEDYQVRHNEDQIFTGYDVVEFENLFADKDVDYITTAGVDGIMEPIEHREDFCIPDEDFENYLKWYEHFSEKRELLGITNHILYICRKR